MSQRRQNEVPLHEIPHITGRALLHAPNLFSFVRFTKFPSDTE